MNDRSYKPRQTGKQMGSIMLLPLLMWKVKIFLDYIKENEKIRYLPVITVFREANK